MIEAFVGLQEFQTLMYLLLVELGYCTSRPPFYNCDEDQGLLAILLHAKSRKLKEWVMMTIFVVKNYLCQKFKSKSNLFAINSSCSCESGQQLICTGEK